MDINGTNSVSFGNSYRPSSSIVVIPNIGWFSYHPNMGIFDRDGMDERGRHRIWYIYIYDIHIHYIYIHTCMYIYIHIYVYIYIRNDFVDTYISCKVKPLVSSLGSMLVCHEQWCLSIFYLQQVGWSNA